MRVWNRFSLRKMAYGEVFRVKSTKNDFEGRVAAERDNAKDVIRSK